MRVVEERKRVATGARPRGTDAAAPGVQVVDADGHVIEPEAMFAHLEEEFRPHRPLPVTLPLDTPWGQANGVWLIEGKVLPNIGGVGGRTTFFLPGTERSLSSAASVGDQTLEDVEARLAGLNRFGIDRQVIYPTLFLVNAIEDVRLEAALFRAYNTYMAEACARSHGRLKWNAPVPFRDPEAAVKEVQRVSDLGAAGIFTLGVVFDRHLSDPAFFPIYDAMSELDLPLCIHLGWGAPRVTELFTDSNAFFCSATTPVIWGFVYVMAYGLLGRFPKLRVGFIETGGEWVPYVINQLRRRYAPPSKLTPQSKRRVLGRDAFDRSYYRDPTEWFREGRAFVACESEENLPYLLQNLGEDALMLASDYPHGDPSADEGFVSDIQRRDDVPEPVKAKLMGGNAARLYRL
jgi:predicted TIM-barrel fold metal-dependent hydrolase